MSMICPQCSLENPDRTSFCARCGTMLQPQANQVNQAMNPPAEALPPATPMSPGYPPQQAAFPPPAYPPYTPQAPLPASPPVTPYMQPAPPRTSQGLDAVQHAFAGHGMPLAHHAWLLAGKQAEAGATLNAITDALRQQGTLVVSSEKLKEQGAQLLERDYVAARLGTATALIYDAPIGNNLYISRTITLQTTLSYVRVVCFGIIVLAMIIGFILFNVIKPSGQELINGETGAAAAAIFFFGFLSYLLLALILIVVARCLISLLTEKDFMAPFRSGRLSDFQIDEVAALEMIADASVRAAVKQVGGDEREIVSPGTGYQPRRRVRFI